MGHNDLLYVFLKQLFSLVKIALIVGKNLWDRLASLARALEARIPDVVGSILLCAMS